MSSNNTLAPQYQFWTRWTREHRLGEDQLNEVSLRQRQIIDGWLESIDRVDLEIIEVGCGSGWMIPTLERYGCVTATDLVADLAEQLQPHHPRTRFVAGDFMALDFPEHSYDVVVSVETLSHVADQPAFVAKLARLLRPAGHLMLATQNRPVLQHFNRIPPPGEGQLRHWIDRRELRDLVQPHFDIVSLATVTPRADRWPIRLITSHKVNRAMRALVGDRYQRLQERAGLGWTLMLHATKRRPGNAVDA